MDDINTPEATLFSLDLSNCPLTQYSEPPTSEATLTEPLVNI